MTSRRAAEQERQMREKQMFLAAAGVGFAGSVLGAVAWGHRRALRAARQEGTAITSGQVGWAVRAFGLGTMYALAVVGGGVALTGYYLQVTSVRGFADALREKVRQLTGREVPVDAAQDKRLLDKADRWLTRVDEETGQKRVSFKRVKSLLESDTEKDGEPAERLSVGARMRAAVGFGRKKKDTSTVDGASEE
ncbi:hypothetical protein GGF46_002112 [Coemansia sp. RSA 552]|nr:hypothetical protein GGF46_002112 [Coemansia sp. RSA 552]